MHCPLKVPKICLISAYSIQFSQKMLNLAKGLVQKHVNLLNVGLKATWLFVWGCLWKGLINDYLHVEHNQYLKLCETHPSPLWLLFIRGFYMMALYVMINCTSRALLPNWYGNWFRKTFSNLLSFCSDKPWYRSAKAKNTACVSGSAASVCHTNTFLVSRRRRT